MIAASAQTLAMRDEAMCHKAMLSDANIVCGAIPNDCVVQTANDPNTKNRRPQSIRSLRAKKHNDAHGSMHDTAI